MAYEFKVGDIVDRVKCLSWWNWMTGDASPTNLIISSVDTDGLTISGVRGHFTSDNFTLTNPIEEPKVVPEYTGGSVDYYKVPIVNPTTPYSLGYIAECNDIIEALGMNYAEGNSFKAIWRRAAQRTLGKHKAGAKDDGLYDAEKVEFFGKRLVEQSKAVRDAKDSK